MLVLFENASYCDEMMTLYCRYRVIITEKIFDSHVSISIFNSTDLWQNCLWDLCGPRVVFRALAGIA